MTTIRFYPDEFMVEIRGHAGFAPAGQDLVCNSISVLTMTLVQAAMEEEAFLAQLYTNEEEAVVRLRCYPDEDHEAACTVMFRTIMTGWQVIQEQYPEYLEIIGGHYG